MTYRLASAAVALTLALGAPAAFAQSYNAPAGLSADVAPGSAATSGALRTYNDLTTGSISAHRGARGEHTQMRNTTRGVDAPRSRVDAN